MCSTTTISCISPVTGETFSICLEGYKSSHSIQQYIKDWIVNDYLTRFEKYVTDSSVFIKATMYEESSYFNREKDAIKLLNTKKWVPVPQLIDFGICEYEVSLERVGIDLDDEDRVEVVDLYACVLVTENCGVSIGELYKGCIDEGPGTFSECFLKEGLVDQYFPKEVVPNHVRCQIVTILQTLLDHGWSYGDIHGGNFLVKDDVVYIIDFECMEKVE